MSDEYHTSAGQLALDQLSEQWALHDGRIVTVAIHAAGNGVMVRLVCVPRIESPVAETIIDLANVSRMAIQWTADDPEFYFVSSYAAFMLNAQRVYLSLDPFDDQASLPSPRDEGVFEAEGITVSLRMKPNPTPGH